MDRLRTVKQRTSTNLENEKANDNTIVINK